jgi:Mg-chelatase subunit ChlD
MASSPLDRARRWRLILGKSSDEPLGGAHAGGALQPRDLAMDRALGAVFGGSHDDHSLTEGTGTVAEWLDEVRTLFDHDNVVALQRDAMARDEQLKTLLLEPELLPEITPSIDVVTTLLALKELIPDRSKEAARAVVRAAVDEITRRLKRPVVRAVRGALDRTRRSPLPGSRQLDFARTVRRNLGTYSAERRAIIPERLYFHGRSARVGSHDVIVCLDQSGSMAESVVYAGVMASIFASIPALRTRVAAFDAAVVDLSEHCADPVDLLFGVQLGGGTDIARAVAFCQRWIERPRQTLFVLITDLFEGGDADALVQRLSAMRASGVQTVCLLALGPRGAPQYDTRLAQRVAEAGVATLACSPDHLAPLLEALLSGRPLPIDASTRAFDPSR